MIIPGLDFSSFDENEFTNKLKENVNNYEANLLKDRTTLKEQISFEYGIDITDDFLRTFA